MFKKSKSDSKSYGIIGLGRFGSALAVELAKSGAEPLVIDGNEEKVREMREYTENAFVVNSFDKKTLSETGIQNCDVAVVCIGEKMDTSILTTLNVVSLGVPTVISKAASAEQGEILKKVKGERYRSELLNKLGFGRNNERIENCRTEYDWISRDEEIVEKYAADELCTFVFTVNA